MSLRESITLALPRLPGYRGLRPRRTQVYAVGCPKTGTHSLASLFARRYRAVHEAEPEAYVAMLARVRAAAVTDDELGQWLVRRDRRLWLEFDSSHVNGEFVATLARELPEARFVLTVREPVAWVDSAINQHLGRPSKPHWAVLRELMYGPRPATFPPQERLLEEAGVYSLDSYFGAWARRYRDVVSAVPAARLLILKTEEIPDHLGELADFCGVPAADLPSNETHQFQARQRFGMLAQLDRAYVRGRLQELAGDITSSLYPSGSSQDAQT